MRRGQGVHGKHSVDVVEDDEVCLSRDKGHGEKVKLHQTQRAPTCEARRRWTGPYHVPVWFSFVGSEILDVGREALVEPQVVPPPQGHQVTEPLQGQHGGQV